jgi:hypothetical protein
MAKGIIRSEMKCNAPRSTPDHATKSHVVKACEGGKEKVIRFGQKGVKGSPDGSARNKAFKARHAKNIAKGKMSAAWWANRTKWAILLPLLNGAEYINYATNSGLTNIF